MPLLYNSLSSHHKKYMHLHVDNYAGLLEQKGCLTCISHSIHANHNVGHVVQGVEDTENVHAMPHCQITEPATITKIMMLSAFGKESIVMMPKPQCILV